MLCQFCSLEVRTVWFENIRKNECDRQRKDYEQKKIVKKIAKKSVPLTD